MVERVSPKHKEWYVISVFSISLQREQCTAYTPPTSVMLAITTYTMRTILNAGNLGLELTDYISIRTNTTVSIV